MSAHQRGQGLVARIKGGDAQFADVHTNGPHREAQRNMGGAAQRGDAKGYRRGILPDALDDIAPISDWGVRSHSEDVVLVRDDPQWGEIGVPEPAPSRDVICQDRARRNRQNVAVTRALADVSPRQRTARTRLVDNRDAVYGFPVHPGLLDDSCDPVYRTTRSSRGNDINVAVWLPPVSVKGLGKMSGRGP